MCGICGIIGDRDENSVKIMNNAIIHRGPDEEGYYLNDKISLASRRLSIIDLSTGSQPIYNEDKSIVIVFNGEIYNFKTLKKQLINKGHKFYTNTDTEVIVHSYEEYGFDCLKTFNGDFSFALYDLNKDLVFIARDRLGIKPFYYTKIDNKIIFSSELKAILASGLVKKDLNLDSIDRYLTLRYNWGEETFINGIKKLLPAHYMIIRNGDIRINKYWNLDYKIDTTKNEKDYIEEFNEIFSESVKLRMISDVPYGAFLSSGLDSSLIVALMGKSSNLKVETFSIGFNLDIDETNDSRKIAELLGCNHNEFFIDKQSYNLIPEIVKYFDEPVGDAIVIPTYLLNKEASKKIKVVLTGEGADEIFGAYVHQLTMHYGSVYNQLIPDLIKNNLFMPALKNFPIGLLDKVFPYPSKLGEKGRDKLIDYLNNLNNLTKCYFSLASVFNKSEKNAYYTDYFLNSISNKPNLKDFNTLLSLNTELTTLNRLIDLDTTFWLADYTLLKQDRLTMANSIEGRVPYLDHNLVEFVAKIPPKFKLNGLTTKHLLRKVANYYLPDKICFKPKKAFYFPYYQCFEEDFQTYLQDIFSKDSYIINKNLINKNELAKIINSVNNSEILQSKQLMSLIILENWLRIYT